MINLICDSTELAVMLKYSRAIGVPEHFTRHESRSNVLSRPGVRNRR